MVNLVDTPTALASDIEKENLFIQYDKSIKKVLANKPILARILKFTVHELYTLSLQQIESCIDGNSVMIGQTFVEPGLSNPKIIINIEAQRKSNPGYSIVNRGIFYTARLLYAQLNTEFTNNGSNSAQYDNMKKVYSIWICMDCPEDKKDSIVSYSLKPEILYQGNNNLNIDYTYDYVGVVIVHLSGNPEYSQNQLIAMLDTLLSEMDVKTKKQKLQEEFQLPMTVEIDQEVSDMCNLSLGLWEKAMNEGQIAGERKGMLLGEKKGRLEGERSGKLGNLRNMLLDGLTTIDKLRATGRYTSEELDFVAKSLKQ